MRHGTKYRYGKGCRCADCTAAAAAKHREYRARAKELRSPAYLRELAVARERKERYSGTCRNCGKQTTGCYGPYAAPELCQACYTDSIRAPHGTRSAYTAGCRCEECRTANRDTQREYRARRRREGGGGSPSPRPPT